MTIPRRERIDRERRAGVFSATFGMMMFFVMLTFAVNLLYNLYTTSVVSSLALDAARDAAEFQGSPGEAEMEFRSQVDNATTFTIGMGTNADGEEVVEVHVVWQSRSLFPTFNTVSDSQAFGVLDRTFTVRREVQQDE